MADQEEMRCTVAEYKQFVVALKMAKRALASRQSDAERVKVMGQIDRALSFVKGNGYQIDPEIPPYCNGKFRKNLNVYRMCPKCKMNHLPFGKPGALSRIDNKTELCPECGIKEGLEALDDLRFSSS